MSRPRATAPSINYVWVGKHPQEEYARTSQGIAIKGQDINEVIKMAKANSKNPITFWCLDEELPYYKAVFDREASNVQVRSIQKYIGDEKQSTDPLHRKFASEMESAMGIYLAKDRGIVRDLVTVKDLFIYYLHATLPGSMYTLDTNVSLGDIKKISLPDASTFRAPLTDALLEIWMLFSSASNKIIAQEAFSTFYNHLETAETIFKAAAYSKDRYTEEYETALMKVTDQLLYAFNRHPDLCERFATEKHPENDRKYLVPLDENNSVITLNNEEMQADPQQEIVKFLIKTYNNTHKLKNRDHGNALPSPQEQLEAKRLERENRLKASLTQLGSSMGDARETVRTTSKHGVKEITHKQALLLLKQYIEQHNWEISKGVTIGAMKLFANTEFGGKPILVDGKEKKIPSTPQQQWEIIQEKNDRYPNDPRAWENAYNTVIKNAMIKENEKKEGFLGVGKRDESTINFIQEIAKIKSPKELYDKINERMQKENLSIKNYAHETKKL